MEWFLALGRAATRLCCTDEDYLLEEFARKQQRATGKYVISYDASPRIVTRQLEFRRQRKMERQNSNSKLSSLAVVDENEDIDMRRTMSSPAISGLWPSNKSADWETILSSPSFDDSSWRRTPRSDAVMS